MNTILESIYGREHQWKSLILFGHCGKGVPGLEIIGLGTKGKLFKEKMIFLSKRFGHKVPLNRYVLCADMKVFDTREDYSWLELPLLLMYWHLAKILPIQTLDNCLTLGRVSTKGEIEQNQQGLSYFKEASRKVIITNLIQGEGVLPLDPLIGNLLGENFKHLA